MRFADCHPDRKHFCKGFCSACYQRQYVKACPKRHARVLASTREWHKANPEKVHGYRLKVYGLTPEQHADMVSKHEGKCAICQRETKLCIDHCHETGTVRGLLCMPCNQLMGTVDRSPLFVERLAEYQRAAINIREAAQ